MNKKVIWYVVGLIVIVGAGYGIYYLGKDKGSVEALGEVGGYLNQSGAAMNQCLECRPTSCTGKVIRAGGHSVCWKSSGLGIDWIN